ncbi:MAG: cyclic nucleotide-binding domain-containing protein [Planctomycetaceae bacterium]|nr:cyclic nucleotide-binding domain-containing protein [Planctomycetaceae bacterium]
MMTPSSLRQLPLFNGISESEATLITSDMTTMKFDAGATILHEGKSIQALWIILQGSCRVIRTASDRSERVLDELRTGDTFGEMSFVRSAPHSATVRAVSEVAVCTWTREDFLKLAESHPTASFRIVSHIAAVLSDRLRRMDEWICEFVENHEQPHRQNEWQNFRSVVYSNWNL